MYSIEKLSEHTSQSVAAIYQTYGTVYQLPYRSFEFSFLLVTVVGQYLETRTPFLELHFPIEHDTCGDNNKMRAPAAFLACQMSQHSDGHDRLAKAHLVSQDTIQTLLVHCDQPVQTNVLVLA